MGTHTKHDSQAASERLDELADILALGLIRMRSRKSTLFLPRTGEISLDTLARQSGAVAEVEGDGP
jgi:hypothetical protein